MKTNTIRKDPIQTIFLSILKLSYVFKSIDFSRLHYTAAKRHVLHTDASNYINTDKQNKYSSTIIILSIMKIIVNDDRKIYV